VTDPLDEEPGQDAGARANLEGVSRIGREQPVEGLGRWARAEPVVLAGDGTESAAQDRSVLVLEHGRNLPEGGAAALCDACFDRPNPQVSRAVRGTL
jgi:hypothetical protein